MSRTDELPDDTTGRQLILAAGYAAQSIGHWWTNMILSQKVCAGRIRTNVPTPGCNIQSLFRILPQHTVALRCAKTLELPQNGFLRGNQTWTVDGTVFEMWLGGLGRPD